MEKVCDYKCGEVSVVVWLQGGIRKMVDGDILGQFLELTSMQQEAVLSLAVNRSSSMPAMVNQVVRLLERVHYALN